jgi:hypothetical protein
MKLPEVSTYRFPNEDASNAALAKVTQMLSDADYAGKTFQIERIADGHPVSLLFVIPQGTRPVQNLVAAQTLAALLLRNAGIQLPGKSLGDAVSQLEIQGSLYALTHLLPVGWTPIVQAILQAAGVSAPTSIPGILTGAIRETLMAITVSDVEILKALGDAFTLASQNLEKAKADGVVTTDEIVVMVEESAVVALKDTIGPDVPGLDRFVDLAKGVIGALLPLILKPAAPKS